MTTANAIKTLSKYATVKKIEQTNIYHAVKADNNGDYYEIRFHDQGGEAICLHTQRASEVADSQSDYFPGSFWDTMAQCLRHGWGIETRKARLATI